MGSSSTTVLFLLVLSPLCLSVVTGAGAGKPQGGRSNKGLHSFFGARKEKLSHLHFYFHDILSGRNPSAVPIISSNTTSGFGSTFMIDDPLTEGPQPTSKLVGRAQGFYSVASQHELGLLMVMNFAFVSGKYNGSSLSIMGRNAILSDVREMPVIGGTGLFRWARGYAQAHTVWIDPPTGDAVVEYHVHVMHY